MQFLHFLDSKYIMRTNIAKT